MAKRDPSGSDLASTWDALENWKRWLLLAALVVAAILLAFYIAWAVEDNQIKLAVFMAIMSPVNLGIGYYFGTHQSSTEPSST